MSLLSRILEKRRRRRTVSTLDSKWRATLRASESRLKLVLMNLLGAWIRPVRKPLPLPTSEVRSVLILRYDALGDAILATPVWRAIKAANPDIHIGVAGSVRNMALLAEDESIDSNYLFSRGFSLTLLRELRKARRRKWDVAINLFFHDKTRGAIFAKLAAPGAVSVTLVRSHRDRYEKIYSAVGDRPLERTPIILQNMLATQCALALPAAENILPTLPASFKTLQPPAEGRYVILHVEASQDYKEWGFMNAAELTRRIIAAFPEMNVFWTSSEGRAEACRSELSKVNSSRALYLSTPALADLAAAICGALAVISLDTSIIHIAEAERVPILGLYLEPNEFLPFGTPNRVLFAPDGKHVSGIPVEAVFLELMELLSQNRPC